VGPSPGPPWVIARISSNTAKAKDRVRQEIRMNGDDLPAHRQRDLAGSDASVWRVDLAASVELARECPAAAACTGMNRAASPPLHGRNVGHSDGRKRGVFGMRPVQNHRLMEQPGCDSRFRKPNWKL